MVLDILKWLKETSFYEKGKKLWNHELLHKRKVHIKKKKRVYELFRIRKSWYYGFPGVKGYYLQRKKLAERRSFLSIYKTSMVLKKNEKDDLSVPKKQLDNIF